MSSELILLNDRDAKRFWAKVRLPDTAQECWVWTASTRGWDSQKRYGQFRVRNNIFYAHRVAYCLARGFPLDYLTDELAILHDCDNPLCCNPCHLTLGTQLQNIVDMIRKGRNRSGSRKGRSRRAVQEIPV